MKSLRILLFTLLFAAAALAQTPKPSCNTPEHNQFDFWVGEWKLTWPGQAGGSVQRGKNSIKRGFKGCVIEENFDGTPDMPLIGHSDSVYDARARRWKQTWVDDQGSYLDFVGGFEKDQMVLTREATDREGKPIQQRMVWKNIKQDSLDWSWERSRDGGKTWEVMWPIRYERVK